MPNERMCVGLAGVASEIGTKLVSMRTFVIIRIRQASWVVKVYSSRHTHMHRSHPPHTPPTQGLAQV